MRKQLSIIICNLLFLSIFLFVTQFSSSGQPGELDSTFNETGRAINGAVGEHMFAWSSAIQPGGKLIVAGSLNSESANKIYSVLVRYNLNGTPDSSFGHQGRIVTDFGDNEGISSIALTSENKILVGGGSEDGFPGGKSVLARYEPDGRLDSSFGNNGYISREFNAVNGGGEKIFAIKLFSDGNILAVIHRNLGLNLLARYFANGTLDSSFGTLGILDLGYASISGDHFIEVQNDKKFIIVGSSKVSSVDQFDVRRYLSNGQPDLNFNGTGHVSTIINTLGSTALAVKLQPDFKIIVAGVANRSLSEYYFQPGSDLATVRYNSNGTIDSSFAINGISLIDIQEADSPLGGIALQSDGKIVVGITVDGNIVPEGTYGAVRYLANGSLDSGFANNGKKIIDIPLFEGTCFTMQLYRNRIYLAGWANNFHVDINEYSTGFNTFAIQNDGIPLSPVFKNLCNEVADITFSSDMPAAIYQWQISTDGTSFSDINDGDNYSGTANLALQINNSSSSWNGYRYRCVTDKGISNVFTLQFMNTWTGAKSTEWEDPGNWSCGSLPDSNTDVVIKHGPVFINSNTSIKSLSISPGVTFTVNPGFDLNIVPKTSVN